MNLLYCGILGELRKFSIELYNLVSLNSFEFTELVAKRLLLTGEGWGIRNMPGINLEDCDLLKCPHPTAVPQGLSRMHGQAGREKSHWGKGELLPGAHDLFPTQGSPRPRWPSCLSPTVVSSW